MLIKCPECQLQISDKAISCPHCGYPLKPEKAIKQPHAKRMRLPNGFGQISRINGKNLRNPWRVMVSVGKTPEGKPIQKILKPKGYFKTYNEAYEALVKYHHNPYDLTDDTTMEELYNRWFESYCKDLAISTIKNNTTTWHYCSSIYDIKVRNITKRHIRNLYDNASIEKNGNITAPTPIMKTRIRALLMQLFDYAIEYDLADVNIPKNVPIPKEESKAANKTSKPHIDFTEEELNILWQNQGDPVVDMTLIGCFSGWRPQELCTMMKEQVNISEMTMTGGSKTEAGKNRTVPIHSAVRNIIKQYYDNCKVHLFGEYLSSYQHYKYKFDLMVKKLKLNSDHRPHDCRVQFVTMAKKYQVDDYAIKRIVGHTINDLTEAVCTKRDTEWLRSEIEKIKGM